MRTRQLDYNELRQLLKAEQARFKELDDKKRTLLSDAVVQGGNIQEYELVKAQWEDSAQEITHLYKKLHPHFPTGTCYNCGSVTALVLGSGRKHFACVACGTEAIKD